MLRQPDRWWRSEITGRCAQDQPGEINNLLASHTRTSAPLPLDTHYSEPRKQPDRCWRSEITGRCAQDQPGAINNLLPSHTRTSASLPLDTHHSEPRQQLDRWWRSEITGRCAQDQPGEINNLLSSHTRTSASLPLDTHHSGSWDNQIGAEGARSLATAGSISKVSFERHSELILETFWDSPRFVRSIGELVVYCVKR